MPDWYEKLTFSALMDRAAQKFGPKEALCYEGKRWSFSQLKDDVDRCARGLMGLGVSAGDKIALWMPNRPEWIQILFAVSKIGAVLVPVNNRFRKKVPNWKKFKALTGGISWNPKPSPRGRKS